MVTKNRVGAGLLVMSLAAAWAAGCSSSDDKPVNSAGSAGVAEAGESGADSSDAGAANGGTGSGGEPSVPEAGSAGDTGDAGAAGGDGVNDPRTPFEAWDARLAAAKCSKDLACGRIYSIEGCIANALRTAPYDRFFGGADYYGNQLALYTLADSTVQEACLTGIAEAACAPPAALPTSCAEVLVPIDPAAKGASCRSGNSYLPPNPCAAGLECSRGTLCSICVDETPPSDLNGACVYDDDCKPNLICKSTANVFTCQARAAVGQPCTQPSDCATGTCAGSSCKAYVLDGKACSSTEPCLPGLACSTDGLCHPDPAPGPGDACPRHIEGVTQACATWCVFPTPTAASGTCGIPVMQGPSPCSRFAGTAQLSCPIGTYVDAAAATNVDGISDSCICRTKLPVGAPCTAFQQCADGRCLTGETGSFCAKRLGTGETCTGSDCEGSCNPETKKCEAPTVCAP